MFLGAIIGAVTAAVTAIGTAVSTVAASIAPIITTVGGALHKAITVVAAKLPPFLETVGKIANVVGTVAEILGLKKPGQDSPEELGMKAEQSDKKPEDFDNDYEAYINYLHNEVELDKEKLGKLTPEEKAVHSIVGSAIYCEGARQKFGVDEINPELIVYAAKIGLSAKEVMEVVKELKENGFGTQKECMDYLKGDRVEPEIAQKVQNSVKKAMMSADPSLNEDEATGKLVNLIKDIRNIKPE